jgi:hypothetical protein
MVKLKPSAFDGISSIFNELPTPEVLRVVD